jgi:hypothetical protein
LGKIAPDPDPQHWQIGTKIFMRLSLAELQLIVVVDFDALFLFALTSKQAFPYRFVSIWYWFGNYNIFTGIK